MQKSLFWCPLLNIDMQSAPNTKYESTDTREQDLNCASKLWRALPAHWERTVRWQWQIDSIVERHGKNSWRSQCWPQSRRVRREEPEDGVAKSMCSGEESEDNVARLDGLNRSARVHRPICIPRSLAPRVS